MKNGVPVVRRGKDGQPIMFTAEPLIDQETWDLLQDAESRPVPGPGGRRSPGTCC